MSIPSPRLSSSVFPLFSATTSDDYRNGYKEKTVNSSYGSIRIDVPQDRKSTFEPKVVKKRQKDISEIDQKIISMYAKCIWRSKKERRPPCKGELCRRRREYKPPEMGVYDAPVGG